MARWGWVLIGLVVCGLAWAGYPVPVDLMPEPKQVKIERARREQAEAEKKKAEQEAVLVRRKAEAARQSADEAKLQAELTRQENKALKAKLRELEQAHASEKTLPVPKPSESALLVRSAQPAPLSTIRDCPDCPEMVVLAGGEYRMGSPDTEQERGADEGPVHAVSVKRLAMGKHEVTQGEWKSVMGSNPSHFKACGPRCPVEQVSWNDAQEFIRKLNEKLGLAGRPDRYRLPSEAEWEYAARAGTTGPFSFGGPITVHKANYDGDFSYAGSPKGQYRGKTVEVGSLPANPWGLHEMHGNVYEWVEDCYHDSYNAAPKNGGAWATGCDGNVRVLRGGSWVDSPRDLRSALRNWFSPDVRNYVCGFRLARTLPE